MSVSIPITQVASEFTSELNYLLKHTDYNIRAVSINHASTTPHQRRTYVLLEVAHPDWKHPRYYDVYRNDKITEVCDRKTARCVVRVRMMEDTDDESCVLYSSPIFDYEHHMVDWADLHLSVPVMLDLVRHLKWDSPHAHNNTRFFHNND